MPNSSLGKSIEDWEGCPKMTQFLFKWYMESILSQEISRFSRFEKDKGKGGVYLLCLAGTFVNAGTLSKVHCLADSKGNILRDAIYP